MFRTCDSIWLATSLLLRMHNGMKLRDSVIPTYETLMGFKVEQVEFFEVFACFRRLFNSAVWFTTDPERGEMDSRSVEGLSVAEGFSGMERHKDAVRKGYEMLVELTDIRVPGLERYAYFPA